MVHKIIVASHENYKSLAELQYLSHTETFSDFADESWIAKRDLTAYQGSWDRHFRNQGPREQSWVILVENQIIGTISIISLENSSSLFRPTNMGTLADQAVACLRLMYIKPNYIRQGYGSLLIEVASRFMQENKYQLGVLITHAANKRARKFYEAKGWVLDGIIDEQVEEFYKDPPEMRLRARYYLPL